MQYNTAREQLVMPEYGRSIQMMVDMAVETENRTERQRMAETIVKIMQSLHPSTASKSDIEGRLWNHLARISRYRLDIDYPVGIVPQEDVQAHPAPLPYPMKQIRRRHYGHLVEQALEFAAGIQDEAERQRITELVANQMKQDLFVWNRDAMDNALVASDIEKLSGGKLHLDLQGGFTFDAVGESPLQRIDGKKGKRKKMKN